MKRLVLPFLVIFLAATPGFAKKAKGAAKKARAAKTLKGDKKALLCYQCCVGEHVSKKQCKDHGLDFMYYKPGKKNCGC